MADYIYLEERVKEESRSQDTLKLLADYYVSAFGATVDEYPPSRKLFIHGKYGDIKVSYDVFEGYLIKTPYRDTTVTYITGNPYLDMMTLYREIASL